MLFFATYFEKVLFVRALGDDRDEAALNTWSSYVTLGDNVVLGSIIIFPDAFDIDVV